MPYINFKNIKNINYTTTFSNDLKCKHNRGWYIYPKFWIFKREYFVCELCGEAFPKTKWFI